MDTEDLYCALQKNPSTSPYFGGIYPNDQLPYMNTKCISRDKYIVINLDPSYKEGSHWVVAVQTPNSKNNFFFDSYGMPPFTEEIKQFLQNRYSFNKIPLQNPLTTSCGQWCLYFIWNSIQKGHHFLEHQKKQLNDYDVNKWVNKKFNLNEKAISLPFLRHQIAKSLEENRELNHKFQHLMNAAANE